MTESNSVIAAALHVVMIMTTLTASSARLEAAAAASNESRISLPGCPDKCGNISIPYPFGMGVGCFYDDTFSIDCNHTFRPDFLPVPIYGLNLELLNISLLKGQIRFPISAARVCYNASGSILPDDDSMIWSAVTMQYFTFSSTENMLVATGCDTYAWFDVKRTLNRDYGIGCSTRCGPRPELVDDIGSCSGGAGCCQVQIPEGVRYINISARSSSKYINFSRKYTPCSSAFVVAKDSFNFTLDNLTMSFDQMPLKLPVVYDWTIRNKTCASAQAHGKCLCCNVQGAQCIDHPELGGYRCSCSPGYSGNPYLLHGCQDIDECLPGNVNNCERRARCVNTQGSYYCQCSEGFQGNGTISYPCLPIYKNNKTTVKIIVGLSAALGTIFLLLGGWWANIVIKKRKAIKQKAKYFERNGGLMLLQQQRSSDENVVERIRIFTVDELEEATNHFSADRILGHGGQGTVYKGMMRGGRIVAIKKSKKVDESQRGEFINEVVILSQINHRNIVKLLGCCLEIEVPLLVYEFIPNGTLHDHIHHPSEEFPITWKMRLQIASDSASALAYLHFSSSIPIFHRDIKSSNILLDEKYRAKLSDFGTSKSVSIDQTHLTTRVQGTFGYMDPEYFQSSRFTEKSDVYSFGVVLVELLTGEKAIRSTSEKERSLRSWFFAHMEEDSCLFDIVDSQVLKEGSKEELLMYANLAKQCLNSDRKQRPTMQQVLARIEDVRSLELARTNPPGEPKTKQALNRRTQSILQASSSLSTTTNLESRSVDSTEISLLFDTT